MGFALDESALSTSDSLDDAAAVVRRLTNECRPEVMVGLGSGMANVAERVEVAACIPYSSIPGMAATSVPGHPGQLLLGLWGRRHAIVFQGRVHFYEGRGWNLVRFPVLLAARLGVKTCVFTNMSGAINQRFGPGSLVAITDHLNLMGSNPLVGMSSTEIFTDMQGAYSGRLIELLRQAAQRSDTSLESGIYAGVSGPSYETPAEVRALALLGADLVGMSTVGEVITARHLGLECCAISCVANLASGLGHQPLVHHDVLAAARLANERLALLIDTFLRML